MAIDLSFSISFFFFDPVETYTIHFLIDFAADSQCESNEDIYLPGSNLSSCIYTHPSHLRLLCGMTRLMLIVQ